MKPPFLLLAGLFAITHLAGAQPPSSEIEQIERQLILEPSKGDAFDSLLLRFTDGEGLDKLAARWKGKAEAGGPEATGYWRLLSLLSEREGHETDAIEFSQKAVDLAPGDPRAGGAFADALFFAGRAHDAIETFQKALAISKTKEERIESYKNLAYGQQQASDGEGALKTWRQLIQEFPADPGILDEAGDAMTDAVRYSDAESFYEASRDVEGIPADQKAKAIFKLAQLAEIQRADDKARELYASALTLVPTDSWIAAEARQRIEDSFRGDISGFAVWQESWLATHSQDIDTALRLSDALSKSDQKPEAIAQLRKAAELAPARKDVKVALAELLVHTAEPREGIELLRNLAMADAAQATDQERLADAEWQIYEATNDESARKAAIEAWLRLAPGSEKNPERVLRAAQHLGDHGLEKEALPLYERAAGLAPDAAKFRERWADYLTSLKRDAEARKVLHGIVEGPHATAPDFLQLARLLRQRNEGADALQTVRAGLDLDPKNFELLSLEWTLLAADNQWQGAADLAARLIEAAPSLASATQVEDNHAQALRKLGKLGDTLQKYGQRLTGGTPPSETEMRLLVALALRGENLDLASKGLEAAARLFPNSAALVHDRSEYERRKGHLDLRVSALQRLSELQPEQKTAWLRQITRVYQDEQLWDSALAAAQRLIDADPANPDFLALAADIEFAAGHFDAGAARLREAIHHSNDPSALRVKLAKVSLRVTPMDEARLAFESAFAAESDPVSRVTLSGELADAYARSGRLGELVARFRRREREGKDGWRSALYLSEIFRRENDFAAARQELTRAFGPRSRDIAFLTQSLKISAGEHSAAAAERARVARRLAEADPGDERALELVSALSSNGEAEEALRALRGSWDALLKDPLKWHDTLLQLAAASGGRELARLLQSALARRADDWRLRLLLAEAQMHNGDFDAADQRLREIESLPEEAVALPPSSIPDAAVNRSNVDSIFNGISYSSGFSGSAGADFSRRILRGYAARQILVQIATSLDPSFLVGADFYRANLEFAGMASLPQTLGEAADTALVMRSMIAQQRGSGRTFLSALEDKLKAEPRSERLTLLTLAQALDPLTKEIAAEAEHPSGDQTLSADCLDVLMSLANQILPASGSVDLDLPQWISLLRTFLQRERRAAPLFAGSRILSNTLLRAGRVSEAQEAARDILSFWSDAPESQDLDLFQFAVDNGDLEIARQILARLAFNSHKKGPSWSEDLIASLQREFAKTILAKKHGDANAGFFIHSTLRESYRGGFPNLSNIQTLRIRSIWSQRRVFLDGNRYIASTYQSSAWSEIFHLAKRGGVFAEFRPVMNGLIHDLPPAETRHAKMARICFLWWDHRWDDAIREIVILADAEKSDELHLMAAAMLSDRGRRDEAQKALDQVWASSGDAGVEKLVRLLELALAANDTPKAKQLAMQLAGLPLFSNDLPHLVEILNQLGFPEKAAELTAKDRERWQSLPGSGSYRLAEELRRQTQAKHGSEAIGLARLILSQPAPERYSTEDTGRQSAIAALKQFEALPAYIEELEQALKKTPNSAPTLLLLAEASENDQPEECIDYYRRLVRLEPGNMDYQFRLAQTLSNKGQTEEAMRIWETILARHPETILGNHFYAILRAYQSANQVERLGNALLEAQDHTNPIAGLAFSSRDASQFILPVAEDLHGAGNVDEAIRLWRAVLDRKRAQSKEWPEQTDAEKNLVSALLEKGRKDEAAQELETYFFPPAKPKSALGFDIRDGAQGPLALNYTGAGPEMRCMPLVRLAEQAGALEKLRARAAIEAAAHPQGPEKFLVLLMDIVQRDPAKLGLLKTEFDEALRASREPRNPTAAFTLFSLARTLSEWPMARSLALSVEESCPNPSESIDEANSIHRARLAAQLGENKIARQALGDWSDASDRAAAAFDLPNLSQQLSAADLMSRVGMETEAGEVLRKLRASLNVRSFPDAAMQAEEISNRLALLAGDNSHVQIAVWTAPRNEDAKKTTIFWEIGAAPGIPVQPAPPIQPVQRARPVSAKAPADPPPTIAGEDLPELDGRFSIELFHGPTPSALEPLITISAAKTRGAWESTEPLPQGYLVAILREKGAVVFTQKVFIPGGANQLVNPDLAIGAPQDPAAGIPGWPGLNPAGIEASTNAPNRDGHAVRVCLLKENDRSTIPLQRIPIEPAKNYYFTSWLRAEGNGARAGLGGQFLDKDGKPIGHAPPSFTTVSRRWVSCSIRLSGVVADNAHRRRGREQIPNKAAFFEPQILTGGSVCEMSGLYFGEISPDSSPVK